MVECRLNPRGYLGSTAEQKVEYSGLPCSCASDSSAYLLPGRLCSLLCEGQLSRLLPQRALGRSDSLPPLLETPEGD